MSSSAYTEHAYRDLLRIMAEAGYEFADYRDDRRPAAGRVVYLRHDIDYSPACALSLARINAHAGATGTFFFQLRSPIYNFHSYATVSVMREICALGQRVGLHYCVDGSAPEGDLAERILVDYQTMKTQIPSAVPVFSWHNPSVYPGLLDKVPDVVVPGLVNTYARKFGERVKYYSDSNLRYSIEELKAIVLRGGPYLQLLFHPFQWLAGGRDMQEVLANTWIKVLREKEQEFLTNHVYRRLFPSGMPEEWLGDLAYRVAEYKR